MILERIENIYYGMRVFKELDIMKPMRNLVLITGLLILGGCTMFDTYSEIDALNEAKPSGSPFTRSLAEEYKVFANRELEDMLDYPDALHFARKGLAAASGEAVMPEPVTDWNLSERHIKELSSARGRIIVAYDLGAREIAPAMSAKVQSRYDCWIERQEENWEGETVIQCKTEFYDAINELEAMIQKPAPQMPSAEPPPMVPEEAMYLVFFNWDSTVLSSGAKSVLDAVAEEVGKNTPAKINVLGHADTSGDAEYNKKLAFKRAVAVRDYLVSKDVDAELMAVESRGETDLLVSTSDNVREPANRRVNITFE